MGRAGDTARLAVKIDALDDCMDQPIWSRSVVASKAGRMKGLRIRSPVRHGVDVDRRLPARFRAFWVNDINWPTLA